MAYGSKLDHKSQSVRTEFNGVIQGTQNFSSVPSEYSWIRLGSNLPPGAISGVKNPRGRGPLKWQLVTVPKGPRLPYKVWSKRLQKWVWARKPVQILRLLPDKPKKKARGQDLPPNPLNFTETRVTWNNPGARFTSSAWFNPQAVYTFSGDTCQPFKSWYNTVPVGPDIAPFLNAAQFVSLPAISTAIADADSIARSQLYSAAKGQYVNLAQAIAERKQTMDMFVQGANRLLSALRMIKRGNLLGAAKKLFPASKKDAANDWLMIQYGIRPLLSDLDGAARTAAEVEPLVFDVIGRKKNSVPTVRTTYEAWHHGFKTEVSVTADVIVKYKVRAQMYGGCTRLASRLGLESPVALAWELIPYSFVIDWALPLGDYLGDIDAFAGLKVLSISRTVFVRGNVTFSRSTKASSVGTFSGGPTGFSSQLVSCQREILSSLPGLDFPSVRSPISAGHAANALALIVQSFTRR